MTPMIAMHRNFELDKDDKRQPVAYVTDQTSKVTRYAEAKLITFIDSLEPGTVVRVSAVSSSDHTLIAMSERGLILHYANWHKLGIDKGQSPDVIALALFSLSSELFYEFKPNEMVAKLRAKLSVRNALVGFYGDAVRRLRQVGRDSNVPNLEEETFSDAMENLDILYDHFKMPTGKKDKEGKEKFIDLDRDLENYAKQIPECVLFNQIAHISGAWITAASVVAFSGGIDRFERVQSLWHYFGMHVVDGKAPRRKAGNVVTWSPNCRKTMYCLGDSIIKNRANPWRDYFDEAKAQYLSTHTESCGCKYPDGHSNARARRKMVKEILKRFFLAAKNIQFEQGHQMIVEDQSCDVTALGASGD